MLRTSDNGGLEIGKAWKKSFIRDTIGNGATAGEGDMPIDIEDITRLPKDLVVFFCWQDHLDPKLYRYLIRDALNAAIARVQSELPATADCKIRQDSDTMNRAGAVEIANTIYQKIRQSTVVIADVTPVFVDSERNWFYPNPNVMTEVGIAGAAIGWNRVVCMFDEEVCTPDQLPFDIRHRRATGFRHTESDKKKNISDLEGILFVALRAIVQEIGRGVVDPALSDGTLKRARDLRLLRELLSTVDVNFVDYYIDRGLEAAFVYDILFYWHGFEATVQSVEFRFYDHEMERLIRELYGHWRKAIDFGGMLYHPNGMGGHCLKSAEYWGEVEQDRFDGMIAGLEGARKSLRAFVAHVHANYPELDLRETNRGAYESIKKYLTPAKG